ncbi:hypothetical protein [Reyranella sp.]|uniref:hypothetical protein n=1 Tax=Reyranella sp. TaxID=1929291 RepID=UPI0040359DD0
MTHSQYNSFLNAMLLLMAILDNRREAEDEAAQRRAVKGALKTWATGVRPTATAVEQLFEDVQEVLERFFAYCSAQPSGPLAVEVREIVETTRSKYLSTRGAGLASPDFRNQLQETVTPDSGDRS